jgi:hypothetical protein
MVRRQRIIRPPRLAIAILSVVSGRPERAYLIGDLREEFRTVALNRGRNAAFRWYWEQAVRSVGPLLIARLTSERLARSVGATIVGWVTAIVSATVFGLFLERALGLNSEATHSMIAMVVAACALVSSTCAGWASTWVSGGPYRSALVLIGLVVVAPDIVYAARHHGTYGLPWVLLPPSLAILATGAGLVIGGKLCRLIHLHS